MTEKPTSIVIAKPPRKRDGKAVAAAVIPVKIVHAPEPRQRDACRRFMELTGRLYS